METPLPPSPGQNQLTDILGLRLCGIFPAGKEPSIRTLRQWTKLRRIPHHRVGHFVYYDPSACTGLTIVLRSRRARFIAGAAFCFLKIGNTCC
jgi:hypothetical protein